MEPSEYPERMLITLVKAYRDPRRQDVRVQGMDWTELAVSSGILSQEEDPESKKNEIEAALDEMEDRGWVTAPFKTFGGYGFIRPTPQGIDHALYLMRPWHNKIWDSIKTHPEHWIPPIIVGIISILALVFSLIF